MVHRIEGNRYDKALIDLKSRFKHCLRYGKPVTFNVTFCDISETSVTFASRIKWNKDSKIDALIVGHQQAPSSYARTRPQLTHQLSLQAGSPTGALGEK